jgi:hypothetical protein
MATKDDGGVSEKIAGAKKTLDNAWKSNVSGRRPSGSEPVKPVVDSPKSKAPSAGLLGEAASAAQGLKDKADNVGEYMKASGIEGQVPKMHDGGPVKEDGIKNLQEGEFVLPKNKAKEGAKIMAMKDKAKGVMNAAKEEMDEEKSEKKPAAKKAEKKDGKKAPHNFARTETIHHPNGSHTTTHHYRPGKPGKDGKMAETPEPMTYASPDHGSMMQGMDDNLGGGPQGAPQGGAPAGGAPEAAPAAL